MNLIPPLKKPMDPLELLTPKTSVPKPSDFITIMVRGLKEIPVLRKNFVIDMGTFGEQVEEDGEIVCYGCAATCAILTLSPESPVFRSERNDRFDSISNDLQDAWIKFECAVDEVRRGGIYALRELKEYYDDKNIPRPNEELPYLGDEYSDRLEPYEQYARQLKEAGF